MSRPALELRGVHKRFGRTEVIRGANLSVAAGESVAIIGPNGAGKSTLFNLISGRVGASSGQILLHGQSIDGLQPHRINRLGLARSFQVSNLFPRLSAFENLRCAVLWSLGYRYSFWQLLSRLRDANQRAAEVLERIGLGRRRDVPAMNLTYAEQRALEIGITIAGGADVVLLDEPTAGMSRSETARFIDLIRDITVGKTLLTVEHDMGVVFGLADRIAVLVHGEVIAFDTPDRVRGDPARPGGVPGFGAGRSAGCCGRARELRRCSKLDRPACLLWPESCAAWRQLARSSRARSWHCSGATAAAARPRSRPSWDWSKGVARCAGTGRRSSAARHSRSRTPASATCPRTATSFRP